MTKRVVVTGMGTVNSIGLDVATTWNNAIHGVSGIGPITYFDPSDLQVQIACEMKGFDPSRTISTRLARRTDLFEQYALVATHEALQQSGLEIQEGNAERVAVVISTAVGGLISLEGAFEVLAHSGARRISPFVIPKFMPNGASGMVAIETGAKGPCYSVASACASGADSIGQAWLLLKAGVADAALAGGSEATVCRIGIATFDRVGALSRRNDPPYCTPSPFDAHRDGLVMGEGAGVLVLETLEHAEWRGAEVLAELIGYASTTDAYHITAPSTEGDGGAAAIRGAVVSAGLNPEEIDYINAHGTGTRLNDTAETRAIKKALGEHAQHVPISSTKSVTGHMMGATGALEGIFCVQSIRENIIPPTIHLHDPDPECDLDYVPHEAREHDVRVAMSNAFGFGGHNAVLAFREFSG